MNWWLNLLKHKLFRDLAKVTLFNLAILAIFPIPALERLLIIFSVAGSTFLVGIILTISIINEYRKENLQPNYGTLAYLVIGIGGLLFSLSLVIPSLFAIETLAHTDPALISYFITFAFAYPVWTFYFVTKRGYDLIRGNMTEKP